MRVVRPRQGPFKIRSKSDHSAGRCPNVRRVNVPGREADDAAPDPVHPTRSSWGAQGHGHILQAGPSGAERYTVEQIRGFLDSGNDFYVVGQNSGRRSQVAKYDCSRGIRTIRSYADGVWDNNLDSLPSC